MKNQRYIKSHYLYHLFGVSWGDKLHFTIRLTLVAKVVQKEIMAFCDDESIINIIHKVALQPLS